MDEAEYSDRIAIIDRGTIIAQDTPSALKASVGKDRVSIGTDDNELAVAAVAQRFGLTASVVEGQVTLAVENGEQFVPRLFAELGRPIFSVSVARPSLDDVFLSFTGTTIREAEASATDRLRGNPMMARIRGGR
jgi:ABC-2 type transport system ATP-binding protein